jgi:membrane fusion protein (multidrug efflux system)
VQQRSATRVSILAGRIKSLTGRTKILVASIAFIIGGLSTWLILDSVLYERSDDAQIDGHIMPLTTRINGHVQQVNAIEGQMVHAGDVLAALDQKEYNIAVYQAIANLAYAENTAAGLYFNAAITVTTAYSGLNSAQNAVKSAQAEVAAAEDKLRADETVLRQVQANRAQIAIVEAIVAADQQALLETKEELVQAAGNLRNAQTAPEQASLAKVRAQAADSQVLQCKAQLEQAQLNLGNTIIRSPVTGIVGKRRIEAGQNVSVGQELMECSVARRCLDNSQFQTNATPPPKAWPASRNQGRCLWPQMERARDQFGRGRQFVVQRNTSEERDREPREGHVPSTRSHRF